MSQEEERKRIRDAATLVLLRDGSAGLETFLLKRHGRSGFMAGAHVFPGGQVDSADGAPTVPCRSADGGELARQLGEEIELELARALFVAAIRETLEEASVLVGEPRVADPAPNWRRAEETGDSFGRWLAAEGITLALEALVPYARWITPPIEKRRFDTRFFLTRAPHDQRPAHDGSETTESGWFALDDALEAQRRGEILLAPPTLKTLADLDRFASTEEALAAARSRPPPRIEPRVGQDEGAFFLAIPGDPEHEESEPAFPGPTRFLFEDGIFRLG